MITATYDQLNDFLREVIFTKGNAFRPAYVELDEAAIHQVAEFLNCEKKDVRLQIAGYVSQKIQKKGSEHDPFLWIFESLMFWRGNASKEYSNFPELPLLLVLTFAAVDMGGEGGHDPNAYYPRLHEMLKISTQNSIADSYRSCSELLWNSLNHWLDTIHKGKFGLGTAYSIGAHKHVGFPLSQALIRSGDRKKLPRLFRKNGFSAFASMVEYDIEATIEEWVSAVDQNFGSYRVPSRPFIRLWEQSDARLRMCSIVCRELEAWDGSVQRILREDGIHMEDDELLVRLEVTKTSFPTQKLNISFALSGFTLAIPGEIEVIDSDGASRSLALSSDPSGWMRPNVGKLPISDQDLLENSLTVQYGSTLKASRPPRKVVILKLDELTRRYREADRVELGRRSFVLVQNFKDLVESVRKVLQSAARQDWKEIAHTDLPGLPQGWTLFSDVELLQPPDPELVKNLNLEGLKPIRSGSLTISSGLQLPGRVLKWHSAVGLEIRVTVVGSQKLTVIISQQVEDEIINIITKEYFQQTLIHSISPNELGDGDYRVSILVDDSSDPLATKSLYIRSSDFPDQETWKNSERLVYDLANSSDGVLNASPAPAEVGEFFHVDGAIPIFENSNLLNRSTRIPMNVEWWGTKTPIIDSKVQSFRLPDASNYPCFEKGNHYIVYPPTEPNRNGTGYKVPEGGKITGICQHCGLVKRSIADPWVATRMRERALVKHITATVTAQIPKVLISNLPSVETEAITFDLALDALMHLGGGTDGYISSIASNVDPSALFRHEFVRTLEQIAHIDVSRDSEYQIKSWEINPSIVVQTNFDFFLTGYWPTQIWKSLLETFGEERVFARPIQNSASRMTIKNVTKKELESELNKLAFDVDIVEFPSIDILKMLPDIKTVAANLPSVKSRLFDEVCLYSPEQNAWVPVSEVRPNKVGGFRLTSAYRNQYVILTKDDVDQTTMRYVSAEFAKYYTSAALFKKPLFSYHDNESQLIVPKGSPLPGLFGRAAVLASGYLPTTDKSGRYLIYTQIPRNLAELLAERLGGQ